MCAVYKGTLYWLSYGEYTVEIVTRNTSKTDETFSERKGVYFKVIDENDLMDIFSVRFYVDYDTGISDTPHIWTIDNGMSNPAKDRLLLRFGKGFLPGWEIEEKNICTKTIGFDDVRDIKISITYEKKDGQTMAPPYVDERVITKEEMIELFDHFKRTNL